jgi:hypothetical protein
MPRPPLVREILLATQEKVTNGDWRTLWDYALGLQVSWLLFWRGTLMGLAVAFVGETRGVSFGNLWAPLAAFRVARLELLG